MAIAHSTVTAQRRTSVPVDICRKLGIGPGSILEWEAEGDKIVVRRTGRFTSEDIHRALFGTRTPETRSVEELRKGIRQYARKHSGSHEEQHRLHASAEKALGSIVGSDPFRSKNVSQSVSERMRNIE